MRRLAAPCLLTLAFAGSAVAAACSATSDAMTAGTSSGSSGTTGDAGPNADAAFSDASATPIGEIPADGIVLVHAAAFPAFRVCFDGTANEQPIPSADPMPDSNLTGVDVGAAIRVGPRPGPLGRAFVFEEEKIRPLYFGKAGTGPTCKALLGGSLGQGAVKVADTLGDLSRGVHLLVLRGGPGDLTLDEKPLTAFARTGATRIPVQLVQLSTDLAARAGGRPLGLAFGDVEAGAPAPFLEVDAPFGVPVPKPPAVLDYGAVEIGDYATSGVHVTLGPLADAGDAGAREVVLATSLADIQRRSAPRSLPPDWFASASSYVLLTVGEVSPREPDGGPGDERRALHLLAVPLVAPDAGADASR